MTKKTYMMNYMEYFFEMLIAERGATENTILSYKKDIKDLFDYLALNHIELEKVTSSVVKDFIVELSKKNLGAKTIGRKISALRQFFSFLVSDGIFKENPTLNIIMPKRPESIPKALSKNMLSHLIETASNDVTKEGLRDYAMLEILYSTGMRISELVALEMKSLEGFSNDSEINLLIVKGKGQKERAVILNQKACKALKNYLNIRGKFLSTGTKANWVFPSISKNKKIVHISRQRFGQILKEIAIKSNIDPSIISPHKIRHSFATHMLDNGANLRIVQELLGHSDISSTQIYTKVSDSKAKKLLLDKHPLSQIPYKN
ncbi:tyrosine recombinase [Candidatus Bandiella numerosa]|jgi:integrase/recombinase XerD|uniref:tyrosine recombinase n=1 Tax=Candidatus Bandiella numerosa TaxID=2570586 RepID=UPI00249D9639|nr:tyrosine recombinase [Candidatus Bandiella numerosa]WHA05259.1 tyrosine recombinase [Candidatus Bandiella numerosa]